MKKVLFALTSHNQMGNSGRTTGYYLPEVTHAFFKLKEAGCAIEFVSPAGGRAPMDPSSCDLQDPQNKAFLDDAADVEAVEHTKRPSDINAEEYDAIYFAGGHGTMWDFPENAELAKLAADIYEHGGIVGAVCHGPAGLVNVRLSNGEFLVKGKEVASFSNDEESAVQCTEVVPFLLESKLKERGAKFTKAPRFKKHVVVSGRLVTGQNPASAAGVGEAMAKLLR